MAREGDLRQRQPAGASKGGDGTHFLRRARAMLSRCFSPPLTCGRERASAARPEASARGAGRPDLDAALADERRVPVRKREDAVVDLGRLGRGLDLGRRRADLAVPAAVKRKRVSRQSKRHEDGDADALEVVAHALVEEGRVLRNDTDDAAERLLRDLRAKAGLRSVTVRSASAGREAAPWRCPGRQS